MKLAINCTVPKFRRKLRLLKNVTDLIFLTEISRIGFCLFDVLHQLIKGIHLDSNVCDKISEVG